MTSLSKSPLFEIDTKGTCLLCHSPETENFTGHDNDYTEKYFKMFLRYLKVDLFKLTNFKSSFQPVCEGSGNVSLSLSLCEKCFSVTHEFFEFFEDFERIRMQLDNCVRKVQEFIENGERDEALVREYRDRVDPRDPKDMMSASVAENLRKETLEKCHIKLGLSIPKVLLKEANSSKGRTLGQASDMPTLTLQTIETVDNHPSGGVDSSEDDCKNDDDVSSDSEPEAKRHRINVKKRSCITSWRCVHCQTYYVGAQQLRIHLIKYHPKAFFAERVPKNVSEQDLLSAVDKLIGKMEVTRYEGRINEPFFQCPWCVRKSDKRAMRAHLFNIHFENVLQATGKVTRVPGEEEKFSCDICGKSATTYNGLRVHKSRTHGKRFHFNPAIKDLRPRQVDDDDSHKIDNVEEAGSSISKKYNNSKIQKRLRYSMKNATMKTPWKCKYCGNYYSTPTTLRTHHISYHTKAFFAGKIPHGIEEIDLENAANGFIEKMNISHYYRSDPYYQCTFCKSRCPKRKMYTHIFRRHFKHVILAAGGTFPKVEVEEKSEARGQQIKTKLSGKTKKKKVKLLKTPACKCTHCGNYYSGPGQLRTHLISQHTKAFFVDRIPEDVSEPDLVVAVDKLIGKMKLTHYYHYKGYQVPFYQCSWCSRKFDRKIMKTHVFRLHLEVVLEATGKVQTTASTTEERLRCDICGMKANTYVGLRRHKSQIHGKHRCVVCKSEFLKMESLKYHQLQCKPQQQSCPPPKTRGSGAGPSTGVEVVLERDSDCDVDVQIKKEPNSNLEYDEAPKILESSNNIGDEDFKAESDTIPFLEMNVKQEASREPKLQLTLDEMEVDLEEDFGSDQDPGPDPLTCG